MVTYSDLDGGMSNGTKNKAGRPLRGLVRIRTTSHTRAQGKITNRSRCSLAGSHFSFAVEGEGCALALDAACTLSVENNSALGGLALPRLAESKGAEPRRYVTLQRMLLP